MARCAPVPDMPPIPGMCPSIAVLAGGGDGGGGSGEGAGDGSGNDQAGANGGGDQATPDGKNAASGSGNCGPGPAGCPNHHPQNGGSAAAGDPIDIVTGRVYTVPALDLILAGPLPLGILREYSSGSIERDVGLGPGWCHSLSWEIEVARRSVRVWKADGTGADFPEMAPGDTITASDGWILRRDDQGFTILQGDLVRSFAPVSEGARRHVLTAIADRNGNRITLAHENGALTQVIDCVGRVVRVRRTRAGKIEAFEVKNAETQGQWIAFQTYAYDDAGDLIRVTDAEGRCQGFTYREHLLTSHAHGNGLTFFYRYDERGRGVESWGEYPGKVDPSLAASAPALLADHQTKARGILHVKLEFLPDGYIEVIDSRQVRRFFGNRFGKLDKAVTGGRVFSRTFDENGHVLSLTDPTGATTHWERDLDGAMTRSTDPLGRVTLFQDDLASRTEETIFPDGSSLRRVHDARGNIVAVEDDLGPVMAYRYDPRGLLVEAVMPNGGTTRMEYDAHGNRTRIVEPNGSEKRIHHDYLGRVVAVTDQVGASTRYAYDGRGSLVAVFQHDGGVARCAYDGAGHVTQLIDEDGRTTELVWGGLNVVCAVKKANGDEVAYRYDREGTLVEIHNERGEVHSFTYNGAGQLIGERTFDGRAHSFKRTPLGDLASFKDALGKTIAFAYDASGQLVSRTYADETADVFEYDALGRIIAAKNADTEVAFTYDARGRLLAEEQVVRGDAQRVERGFDALGNRVRRETSLGLVETAERDSMGYVSHVRLGDEDAIAITRDALGGEVERALPGGATIRSAFDPRGRLTRRWVSGNARVRSGGAGEPDWLGPQQSGVTADRAYRYSQSGELIESWSGERGLIRFEHDPLGQLLSRVPERARAEFYAYDAGGDLREDGAGATRRTYGPGGALQQKGTTLYQRDARSRVIEKRVKASTGDDEVWRYRWGARGLLSAVEAPDGSLTEFVYDSFARRVLKRSTRPLPAGGRQFVAETRFLWDGDVIVQEVRKAARRSGDPIIEERSYCYADGTSAPWAQQVTRVEGGARSAGPWTHYVNDPVGAPELLVSSSGQIVGTIARSAFGAQSDDGTTGADTPLGFQGQYADSETGLAYNRWRYYDPDTGRYLDPEPMGVETGLDLFGYVENRPHAMIDPLGLFAETVIRDHNGTEVGRGQSGSGRTDDRPLHPAVVHSLPPSTPHPKNGQPIYPCDNIPGQCSEPHAMSNYLYNYEQGPPPRSCNPRTAEGQRNLREAMSQIPPNGIQSTWRGANQDAYQNGAPMAPCPNCSAMFTNMQHRYGLNPASVQPGFPPARTRGDLSTRPPATSSRAASPEYTRGRTQERERNAAAAQTRAQDASESREEARENDRNRR